MGGWQVVIQFIERPNATDGAVIEVSKFSKADITIIQCRSALAQAGSKAMTVEVVLNLSRLIWRPTRMCSIRPGSMCSVLLRHNHVLYKMISD